METNLLYRILNPRKAHIYCIGTAKSGTHSIEALFSKTLRCAHEAESEEVIDLILDSASGRLEKSEIKKILLKRDRKLWLEIDSSQLNFFLMDHLLDLFPKAKFILTIRDPYSWLDSFINHQLARGASDRWIQLRDFRFQASKYEHPAEEALLKENGLYTLDGYLSYWTHHNQTVIDTVPKDRLLVVRTDQITKNVENIAAFAGIEKGAIHQKNAHAFKAAKKFGILEQLNRDYLASKIDELCGDLMRQLFPNESADIMNEREALTQEKTRKQTSDSE